MAWLTNPTTDTLSPTLLGRSLAPGETIEITEDEAAQFRGHPLVHVVEPAPEGAAEPVPAEAVPAPDDVAPAEPVAVDPATPEVTQ